MTYPVATVISISGSQARVEVADRSACPRCAAGKGCGAGIFGPNRESISLTVDIAEGVDIVAGDQVTLSLAPADLVHAAFFAYGAPLLGVLSAAGLAYLLVDPLSDFVAAVFSISGLLAGGIAGRVFAKRDDCVNRLSPSISGHAALE